METFMKLLETIQTFVWGPPTLVLLMGTGLYFTYKLRGIQICKFPRALKSIFEKEEGAGDVSPFATLCTTLAADIGTGSIVGVATALRIGGPGAMFWMWVSALLGMTTKYAEALLAPLQEPCMVCMPERISSIRMERQGFCSKKTASSHRA